MAWTPFGTWTGLYNDVNSMYTGAVNDITNPISASSVSDREYNANREDTQYQRLREDLSAAGLNNWLAVNGSAQPAAAAISNTSEGLSRARELGFKYQELMTKALTDATKMLHTSTEKNADRVWDIVKKFVNPLSIFGK